MSGAVETLVGLELLEAALKAGAGIVELVTERDRKDLEERIARAKAAVKDPIDTTEADTARRAELERILRGTSPTPVVPPLGVDAGRPAIAVPPTPFVDPEDA